MSRSRISPIRFVIVSKNKLIGPLSSGLLGIEEKPARTIRALATVACDVGSDVRQMRMTSECERTTCFSVPLWVKVFFNVCENIFHIVTIVEIKQKS